MTTTAIDNLPSQLTEASFRKYELTIQAAVNRFPQVIKIKAKDMDVAPTTYAARLRDALTSLFTYKWKTSVDMNKFLGIRLHVGVSHDHKNNQVIIGSKTQLRNYDQEESTPPIHISADEVTIQVTTLEQKLLLCELSAAKSFAKRIKIFGLNIDDITFLEGKYDVGFKLIEDGSHLLL